VGSRRRAARESTSSRCELGRDPVLLAIRASGSRLTVIVVPVCPRSGGIAEEERVPRARPKGLSVHPEAASRVLRRQTQWKGLITFGVSSRSTRASPKPHVDRA